MTLWSTWSVVGVGFAWEAGNTLFRIMSPPSRPPDWYDVAGWMAMAIICLYVGINREQAVLAQARKK